MSACKTINVTVQFLGSLVHNGVWEHEEGKDRLFWLAKHSETLEPLAVYAEEETGNLRTMPFEEWISGVKLAEGEAQPRFFSVDRPEFYCCTEEPVTLGRWRHYKGGEYLALRLVKHALTGDDMVVYVSTLGGAVWVRPLAMWSERLPDHKNVYRFTRLDSPLQDFTQVPADDFGQAEIALDTRMKVHSAADNAGELVE